jgi:hypothetical protein
MNEQMVEVRLANLEREIDRLNNKVRKLEGELSRKEDRK